MAADTEKDVHTEHCCFHHGWCKYGDSLCPVTSGKKKQSFPCERCEDDGLAGRRPTVDDRVRGLQSNISDAMQMLDEIGLAKHEVEPLVIRVQAAVDEIKRLRELVGPPPKEAKCTCSYDDSEEMTDHAPLCAVYYVRKVPCRKCGLTDEMCLCVAKAYIHELEAKIEALEDDDKPEDPAWKSIRDFLGPDAQNVSTSALADVIRAFAHTMQTQRDDLTRERDKLYFDLELANQARAELQAALERSQKGLPLMAPMEVKPAPPPPPPDPYALDMCQCSHERMHHVYGTEDNNFVTKCLVEGCYCEAYYRRGDAASPQLFYVQDARTFVGNSVMWWCPNGKGYTTHIDQAGKFTAKECATMRGTDVPWRVEDIDKLWSQHIDMQHLRRIDCSNPNCSLPKNHKQNGIPVCDDEK